MEFIKERDFGEIFRDSLTFFVNELKPLLTIILVFVSPFILYVVFFMFKHQAEMDADVELVLKTRDFASVGNKYYMFFIIALIQQVVLVVSVLSYFVLKIKNEELHISFSNVWETFQTSFLNIALGQILILSAILLGVYLFVITSFNGFVFILLLVFSIYISIAMFALSFVIIYEKISAIEAIKRTFNLVKGNWGFTLGSIFVFGLVVGMINLFASSIIKGVVQIISTNSIAEIIVLLLSSIVSVILSVISITLQAYLYAYYIIKQNS